MIVGVKLGSKTLTDGNGFIYEDFIQSVCSQLALLKRENLNVFLVTSGAVACYPNDGYSKNVRAAVGQKRLLNIYDKYLAEQNMEAAQFLYTDYDLTLGGAPVTQGILREVMRTDNLIPIINANDVVFSRELAALYHCADNDALFKFVCSLIGADMALMGTPQKGLCDENGQRIPEVRRDQYNEVLNLVYGGNELGYGYGMLTKVKMMFELASKNIHSMIVNTNEENFILRATRGEREVGTTFV